jgi:hypothetical protein
LSVENPHAATQLNEGYRAPESVSITSVSLETGAGGSEADA